jgi:hypothetical protein
MHQLSKFRVIPYLGADVFTLGLAEIILWPLEMTVMKDATCQAVATYDSSHKLWRLDKVNKSGLEAQGC